jgi:hypothetical protein
MNRYQKAEQLLRNLREAIDEAVADSSSVLAALGELEDAGFCPSFSVDITYQESALPSQELVSYDEGLILTASDESFLRTLGIAAPMV